MGPQGQGNDPGAASGTAGSDPPVGVATHSGSRCREPLVGTGDSPLTVLFYQKCGFRERHRVKNFFPEHYDHAIVEAGVRLVDMVYLSRTL